MNRAKPYRNHSEASRDHRKRAVVVEERCGVRRRKHFSIRLLAFLDERRL
jgi:hypothetical protein